MRTTVEPLATPPIGRRSALVLGASVVVGLVLTAPSGGEGAASLASLEAAHGGRLGVFAVDVATSRTLSHRADESFKLYSTFKMLLAALVLSDVAKGRDALDAVVRYGKADLLAASPVTDANVARGAMTVRELCDAMMSRSDNAAANLLMARFGGPARLTRYLRSIGDRTTRVDSYEGRFDGRPPAFDATTPHAIASILRTLLTSSALTTAGRAQLANWLVGNQVGGSRLRAALPHTWRTGDRTGTGDGYCNDVAFATPSGRSPLVVAAFHQAVGMSTERQEAVLREVGRIVVDWQSAASTRPGPTLARSSGEWAGS